MSSGVLTTSVASSIVEVVQQTRKPPCISKGRTSCPAKLIHSKMKKRLTSHKKAHTRPDGHERCSRMIDWLLACSFLCSMSRQASQHIDRSRQVFQSTTFSLSDGHNGATKEQIPAPCLILLLPQRRSGIVQIRHNSAFIISTIA
jgi:hypothetical protein